MSHGSRLAGNTRIQVNVWNKPNSRPSSNTGKRPKSVTVRNKPTKGSTVKQQCHLSISGVGAHKNTKETTESVVKKTHYSDTESESRIVKSSEKSSIRNMKCKTDGSNVEITAEDSNFTSNGAQEKSHGEIVEHFQDSEKVSDVENSLNSAKDLAKEVETCSLRNIVRNSKDTTKTSELDGKRNTVNSSKDTTKCSDGGTKASSRSDNGGSNEYANNSKTNLTFTCEVESDVTSPWLRGLACMANGDIVCLDLNNESLKRFNINLEHISSIEVSPDNNGLTKVSDSEIAITCLNEVHFYHVGKFGMNRLSKHFRLQGMGYGISHNNNWFAVTADITEEEDATIRVLDQDGNEQYIIESREINGSQVMLSWYIQLDELKEHVYISDAETPQVVCFSFYGDIVWTLPINGGGPRDLLLVDDNLLLSNQSEQKVVKVLLEGRQQNDLFSFSDGVINPDYIAHCSESKRLYVTYRGFGTIGAFVLK